MTKAALSDFDAELEQVKRARANIDFLRKQRIEQPKGEMIGRYYAAPHWAEQLAPAIQQIAGIYAEKQTGEREAQLSKAMKAQADQWIGARPQTSQFEVPGPVQEGQGPLMSSPVQPTQQQNLEWAQQGAKNPLTKALAAKYQEDVLFKEPERQEAREWKSSEAQKARDLKLEVQGNQLDFERKRLEENMIRYKDDREATKLWKTQHDNVLVKLEELKKERAENVAETKATAAGTAKAGKPVPNTVAKTIRAAKETSEGLNNVSSTYKDEYGGLGGAFDKLSGTWNPAAGKKSQEAASWWKNYENQAALVERHEKFGTALSGGEQDAWRAATIAPGMNPGVIRKNLETRAKIAKDFYRNVRQEYIDLDYPQVGKAFPDPYGPTVDPNDPLGLPSTPGAPVVPGAQSAPVAPQTPVMPIPASAMPPGIPPGANVPTNVSQGPPVTAQLPPAEMERASILMSEYRKPLQPIPGEDPTIQAGRYATDKESLRKELARIGVDAETGGPLQRRATDKAPVATAVRRKKFNAATGMLE